MSDKENVVANDPLVGELSAEQRSRISQSFRAAKALLSRKRMRLEPASSSGNPLNDKKFQPRKDTETPSSIDGIKRVPLSNISVNLSPAISPMVCKLYNGTNGKDVMNTGAKCRSSPCLRNAPSGGIDVMDHCYDADKVCHILEDGSSLHLREYPLNQYKTSNGFELNSSSNPIKSLASPDGSLTLTEPLNNDFDESILEQIDAVCEKNLDKQYERVSFKTNEIESDINDMSCEKNNNIKTCKVSDEKLETVQGFGSGMYEAHGVKGLGKSQDEGLKNMPEKYAKYILSLNDSQKEAACSDTSIPLVIVAGPGSGKTSTIVGRVLMLLNEGIAPCHILAMTFTIAAADEMRDRIGAFAGKEAAKELTISTFHSFSLQLCRLHAEKFGHTTDFSIYGHGQQRKAIIEAVRLLEDEKRSRDDEDHKHIALYEAKSPLNFKEKSKKWLKFVTQAKASGMSPEDFRKIGDEMGALILQNYNNILKSCNALDYHDFISYSVKLLRDFPEVFDEYKESYKAIVIDEFQDTSSMQYGLLRLLACHKRITIVGDEDQSIFSFNGADVSGFEAFRKDFPMHKEVRLNKNYRSTRYIVEAASFLIQNNSKQCTSKEVLTDNCCGSKITVKECSNEEAQCAFVIDKLLEITSDSSSSKCSYGNIAVLYRRQVTGKILQVAFRSRKIPFNTHGVAFYRRKVVRAIIAMLHTTLQGCDDGPFRRVFKTLLPFEKEEKKKVIEHIDKVSTVRKCSFISASRDIFSAKISGTFKRSQLTQGRKVLLTLDMISKLVCREQSISAVITSVANMIPQKYLLEQRAVLDVDGSKLLNEDNDLRSVLQYLLDDVSAFLTSEYNVEEGGSDGVERKGCMTTLKVFIDYICVREKENFRFIKHENKDSVTLTTIHQSKGLEWDTVFIVKANESEMPLLHEYNGILNENAASLEEERRLLYVAMTRARMKLFILYVIMDSNWQVLQPSRFLREIPHHLLETQEDVIPVISRTIYQKIDREDTQVPPHQITESIETNTLQNVSNDSLLNEASKEPKEAIENCYANHFLKRFSAENRSVVSHLFHQWAKKPAFHEPKRLLNKIAFVIDERVLGKKHTHKSCLTTDEAFDFAASVIKWVQIPAEKRSHLMREKQEHFQKLRIESAMGSSEPSAKQITYLQNLGCTTVPTSRLHASRLIEEYKSL